MLYDSVRCLPRPLAARLRALRHRALLADTGRIDFGDLARVRPVSHGYGFSRGTPVDRFYIERFLARHAADIRGRVLEVADSRYCREFGRDVERQDVLNAIPSPEATIFGGLGNPGTLPDDAFDCTVITQTLQYVFDLQAAVRQIGRSLKPNGVALATVPAISPVVMPTGKVLAVHSPLDP
ncbi:methyltransferase domain-containing protein [Novosphingobium huizhouense]|uniref:methyltransferase domain-containing protein n=1 Tax=Novosphingobium huizhouense TaxID=2866625 RepID=UPI001CD905BB|nr:methyltransferase domain-containing protein [Novosphingobium huizhouense]